MGVDLYTDVFLAQQVKVHTNIHTIPMSIDFITEQKQSCLFIGSTTASYIPVWVHHANSSLIPYIRLEIWVLDLNKSNYLSFKQLL